MDDRQHETQLVAATESRRKRVLVVAPRIVATFTHQDVELLSASYDTELFSHKVSGSLAALSRRIDWADAVLIWFAGRHAAPAVWLARRHRKPVIQVVGGYEAAWIPEINYGINPRSLRACLLRWMLRRATRILAVSEETKAGILRVASDVAEKTNLVYNGVETSRFTSDSSALRNGVLSVGAIARSTLHKKGWDLFWQTAAAMPEVPFIAVGSATDQTARDFIAQRPPNLRWLGELHGPDLLKQFQAASVYFQGSRHESFSLALAEGMASGCVPVVSRKGALPEVAGDVGFYLDDLTPEAAVRAVTAALNAPPSHRIAARKRIIDNFDTEIRRRALTAIVEETLSAQSTCTDKS